MSYSVICPSCNEKNIGSAFHCIKCHTNLIGIPRLEDSTSEHEIVFQQKTMALSGEPKIENLGHVLWHFVRIVLLVDLLVFIVTALVCWWIGWRTPDELGLGFMLGGFLAILLGGASLAGSVQVSRNPMYRYFQSVFPNSLPERTKQNLLDLNESSGFLILMGTAGLLAILVGWLVQEFYS